MLYNTEAIVIRSISYGETHAILSLLTPSGTVAAMARGAKRPQSRLAASVQMCVEGVYTIYQNTGMGNVQQFELTNARRPLREHLDMAAYAAYFCELASAAAEARPHGSEGLYRQFSAALDRLTEANNLAGDVCRVWEAKILYALGASPNWEVCSRCGLPCSDSTRYAPAEGGFVCDACVTRSGTNPAGRFMMVPKGVPILLGRMQRVPLERMGQIRLAEPTRQALGAVLKYQLTDFAGLSLKSRAVLESLDMGS